MTCNICGETHSVPIRTHSANMVALHPCTIQELINGIDGGSGGTGGTQPQIEAGAFELLCSSADPNITYLTYFSFDEETAVTTPKHIVIPGGAQADGIPADAIRCADTNTIETPYCLDGLVIGVLVTPLQGSTPLGTFFVNIDGTTAATPPTGSTPCIETADFERSYYCITWEDGTGAKQATQTIRHVDVDNNILGVYELDQATGLEAPFPGLPATAVNISYSPGFCHQLPCEAETLPITRNLIQGTTYTVPDGLPAYSWLIQTGTVLVDGIPLDAGNSESWDSDPCTNYQGVTLDATNGSVYVVELGTI